MKSHLSGAVRRAGAVVTVAVLTLSAACTDQPGSGDQLQLVEDPVAATPADSPEPTTEPAGAIVSVDEDVLDITIEPETRTVAAALAGDGETTIALYSMDAMDDELATTVVTGTVERLVSLGGQVVATVPDRDRIVFVTVDGGVAGKTEVEGAPVSVAEHGEATLVALREARAVSVLEYEQQVGSISGQIASADQVLTVGDRTVVLDRLRSAVFEVRVGEREIGLGLRAGQGAANAVADRFGRVLVTDARSDGLLAFSLDPLLLRQRYPVPGGVYGIAYDAGRDLAWVTLTERNEVVGFDVAGGEPEETYRFPTVRQPNSVTVDEQTGSVLVASGSGEGIQVIEP